MPPAKQGSNLETHRSLCHAESHLGSLNGALQARHDALGLIIFVFLGGFGCR